MRNENNILRIGYFSDDKIRTIHENALDILQNHGFQVEHKVACEILRDNGAEVDFEKWIVKVKPGLVEKCIESAQNEVLLSARNPEKDLKVKANPQIPVTRNGGGVDKIIDMETGEFRNMILSDIKGLFRTLDALDCINLVSPLYPHDVPEEIRDLIVLETLFLNTSKHVNIRTFSKRNLDFLVKMGEIVAGGKEDFRRRPVFSIFDSPISPLKFPELTVDVFLTAGKYGIPLFIATLPIAGATGPLPMAGMIQLLHTELLAGLVICQTAYPGSPIILHPLAMTMDMRTYLGLSGSIEATMITAGIVEVANKIFNMPVDVHGPWSDTYVADSQSMLERTFQTLLPAQTGAASIAGFGDIQEGLAFCPVQLGIDEELISFTMKALKGIPFDKNRLAVDAIKRVSFNGNYMTDETTLNYMRTDQYQPKILNRLFREEWEKQGAKDINARARERIQKLMKEHEVMELEDGIRKEIRGLIKSIE